MRRKSFIDKGIRCRKPHNGAESAFFDYIRKEGWICTKRGMPDFACYKDDRLILVEVKPNKDVQLKNEQKKLMAKLSELGIECFFWSPDEKKLIPVRG